MTAQMKILDAYALMVFLEDEPGAQYVEDLLIQCIQGNLQLAATTVNLAEVYYNLVRRYSVEAAAMAVQRLVELTIEIVPVDWEIARQAARTQGGDTYCFRGLFCSGFGAITRLCGDNWR